MPHSQARTSVLIGMASLALTSLGQLAVAPIVLHCLGNEALALWLVLNQAFNLTLLVELGAEAGSMRTIGFAWGTVRYAQVVAEACRLMWAIGAVFTLVFIFIGGWVVERSHVPHEMHSEFWVGIALFAVWGAVRFRMRMILRICYVTEHLIAYSLFDAAISAGRPVLASLLLLASPHWLLIPVAFVLAELAPLLIAHRRYRHLVPPSDGPYQAAPHYREMLGKGLGYSLVSMGTIAVPYLAVLVIGSFLDLTSVAVFQCSVMLSILVQRVGFLPYISFFPQILQWQKVGDGTALPLRVRQTLPMQLVGLACLGLSIVFANRWFVHYWVGDSFFAGAEFSILVAISAVASIVHYSASAVLYACERQVWKIAMVTAFIPAGILILGPFEARSDGLVGLMSTCAAFQLVACCWQASRVLLLVRRRQPALLQIPANLELAP